VGGRYTNFILCKGEHLTILTSSYLAELSCRAGFSNVRQCRPARPFTANGSSAVLSRESESTPEVPHTLLIEAEKPVTGD